MTQDDSRRTHDDSMMTQDNIMMTKDGPRMTKEDFNLTQEDPGCTCIAFKLSVPVAEIMFREEFDLVSLSNCVSA